MFSKNKTFAPIHVPVITITFHAESTMVGTSRVAFNKNGVGEYGETNLRLRKNGFSFTQPSGKAWIFIPWSNVICVHVQDDEQMKDKIDTFWSM